MTVANPRQYCFDKLFIGEISFQRDRDVAEHHSAPIILPTAFWQNDGGRIISDRKQDRCRGCFCLFRSENQSGQHFRHHSTGDVGQPVVAASIAIRQPRVIESQQMQNRRMKIIHMASVLSDANAVLVG